MLRRRRLLLVLAAVGLLASVGAGIAAYVMTRPPGDVSRPDVPFAEETPTPTPTATPKPKKGKKRKDRFVWPIYGYTQDHRRVYDPPKPLGSSFRTRWKRKASALLEFPPVMARGTMFQLADDGVLVARAKRTGNRRWRRDLGHLSASTPAVVWPRVFASVLERSGKSRRGRVVAMRAKTGKVLWSRDLPSRTESSPLAHRGRIYVGSEDGTLYCLRQRGGKVLWRYRAAGAIKASPTLSNGLLYFGDYGGQVQAVRARDGKRIWATGVARRALRGGRFYATAAVAFGRVYVGATDGRMYSLSAADGRLAWARQTGGYVYSSPAVKQVRGRGPTVFFGSYDGTFYAMDARSGKTRWSRRSGGKISGGPTVIGNVVYYADLGRSETYGLGVATGGVVSKWPQGGYDPVISDGRWLFLTGRRSITALQPRR